MFAEDSDVVEASPKRKVEFHHPHMGKTSFCRITLHFVLLEVMYALCKQYQIDRGFNKNQVIYSTLPQTHQL